MINLTTASSGIPAPGCDTTPMRPSRRIDRTGHRFGRLIVTDMLPDNRVRVLCDCGTIKDMATCNLISTKRPVLSCGCLLRELYADGGGRKSHGQAKTALYHAWATLIQRCTNPAATGYKHYGGRGITVCDRWRDSFEAFHADMGSRPTGHSIDRIDVNGNYEPGNCRWATKLEQARNKRPRVPVTLH